MILSRRIRLVPTCEQESALRRACGVARFAYNWALAQWQRQYAAGEKSSEVALRKLLNAIKNLGRAYANLFDELKKYRRGELP